MPIIREFRCCDCGSTFESMQPLEDVECPQCAAQEPERVFLTPPAIRSSQTSVADRELKNLAADFGLSDMSNKNGEPVKRAPSGAEAPQFAQHNPQTAQLLSRLGQNSDAFSPVLPQLRAAGGPRNWAKVPEKR